MNALWYTTSGPITHYECSLHRNYICVLNWFLDTFNPNESNNHSKIISELTRYQWEVRGPDFSQLVPHVSTSYVHLSSLTVVLFLSEYLYCSTCDVLPIVIYPKPNVTTNAPVMDTFDKNDLLALLTHCCNPWHHHALQVTGACRFLIHLWVLQGLRLQVRCLFWFAKCVRMSDRKWSHVVNLVKWPSVPNLLHTTLKL